MFVTIYKYPLKTADIQMLTLPRGSRILSVGNQHEHIMLWAMVTESPKLDTYEVRIVGTGNPMSRHLVPEAFIGTVQQFEQFVWHIFATQVN